MINFIQTQLEETIKPLSNLSIREILNLTEHTEDPGNTEVYLAFIANNDEDQDITDTDLNMLSARAEELTFPSTGDYHEEVTFLFQNSEILAVVNLNK